MNKPYLWLIDVIEAMTAGAVLHSRRIGSARYYSLTTADGREFRLTAATFTATLNALGTTVSRVQRDSRGAVDYRYTPPSTPEAPHV